jgi:hypothetical protein
MKRKLVLFIVAYIAWCLLNWIPDWQHLLIGFFVWIGEQIKLLKNTYQNALLRGALFGVITSIVISFYGGAEFFITAGSIYGIITDVVATRFS